MINMKQMSKLLSILLLMAILLVGCNKQEDEPPADENTENTETNEPAEEIIINDEKPHESVEPKLEKFLVPVQAGETELNSAKRYEGVGVSQSLDGKLVVLRKADVDTKAMVTETFTVYNAALNKAVLTITNTYTDGSYTEFDWDRVGYGEDVTLPESIMAVTVEDLHSNVSVIKVATAKAVEIDEEIRKENETACKYEIALTYEYYDNAGTLLAKTLNDEASIIRDDSSIANAFIFGTTHVLFDDEDGQAIRIVNNETETIMAGYDVETEKYGYFFEVTKDDFSCEFIEVYSKTSGKCLLRYNLVDSLKYGAWNTATVLNDGDIFIQSIRQLPEETNIEPDLAISNFKLKVDQIILDVETGEEIPLDLGYIVAEITAGNQVDEEEFKGFRFTEHVVNLAMIYKLENKQLLNPAIVVLDNDMSTMYEMGILVPEHDITDSEFGLELLASGDYLISVGSDVSVRAIVSKDGALRAYLPDDAKVLDQYVVTSTGIFDYDMNVLHVFEQENCELVFTSGDKIVISATDEYDATKTVYYEARWEGDKFLLWNVFAESAVVEVGDEYLIVQGEKYTLYNAKLERVLVTENWMTVLEADGNYLVYTEHEGETLVYTID